MPILENDCLKIEVNLLGGALSSIYDKKRDLECLYQIDERSWQNQDLVIFPFIGAINSRTYTYKGKEYAAKNHGVIRYLEGFVSFQMKNKLQITFVANENTLKSYPFLFNLKVTYELEGYKIKISYYVNNNDKDTMPFSLGGHPALKVSGYEDSDGFHFTDTYIEFESDFKKILRYKLDSDGRLIEGNEKVDLDKSIKVSKEYIDTYKTLIFDAKKINKVLLKSDKFKYRFELPDAPYLAIWTKQGFGDFLCIEPWYGLPDTVTSKQDLSKKQLGLSLKSGKSYSTSYSITILGDNSID